MAKSVAMGTTDTGKLWCLKALTPADTGVPFSGIPDEDSFPVVFQNFQQTHVLTNPLPANPGNWDADVFFYPHPYLIGAIKVTDATGVVSWSTILNNEIVGATLTDKRVTFVAQTEKYRLGYMGITGYHDAAALSNNGIISCAQYMDTPSYASFVTSGLTTSSANYVVRQLETWQDTPRTFSQLQNMPNAYMGAARDGVYAPYRLSQTSQDWQSTSDLVVHGSNETGLLLDGATWHALPAAAAPDYPYGLVGPTASSWSAMVNKRSDTGVLHISIKQIASAAAFTFYYRSGWELQVLPGTALISFAKSSPPFDPTAISAYFAISRELKDAYPASYNDLGTLVTTIGSIAANVLPKVIPAVKDMFKKMKAAKEKPTGDADTPVARPKQSDKSAAQKERDAEELKAKSKDSVGKSDGTVGPARPRRRLNKSRAKDRK